MADTIANLDPILKTLFPDDLIRTMGYTNQPLYGMIAKDTTFSGDYSKEPILISPSEDRSANATMALLNVTNVNYQAFLLSRVSNYASAKIANELIRAASGDNKGSFLSSLEAVTKSMLFSLLRSIAVQMYRSGTGSVAIISPTAVINNAAVPVQLLYPSDITAFEIGQNIAFSATDGSALLPYTGAGAYVIDVDRVKGTLVFSATFGGAAAALTSLVTGVAVSDYMYSSPGDAANGGPSVAMSGLDAWLPVTGVTATPFFGVNRLTDSTRLGGVVYDGTMQQMDEALIDAANLVAREGGTPRHCFMNFQDYSNLVKLMGAKQQQIQRTEVKLDEQFVTVGYHGIIIDGAKGPITVIPDQNCPGGRAYLLQLDTWKFKSLGEPVSVFTGDGLQIIRDPFADYLLMRAVSYYQLSCRAPGWNAVVQLPV